MTDPSHHGLSVKDAGRALGDCSAQIHEDGRETKSQTQKSEPQKAVTLSLALDTSSNPKGPKLHVPRCSSPTP